MSQRITIHPFDGTGPFNYYSSASFGAWAKLVEDWESEGSIDLVEMFDADENAIEVVTCDGEPIGVLDNASIGKADLERFETIEQIELREGAEDAARELNAAAKREAA